MSNAEIQKFVERATVASIFPEGTWVVQIRGKCRGRVGRVSEHPKFIVASDGAQIGEAKVQFGTDGPFENLKFASLRKADADEIPDGVG